MVRLSRHLIMINRGSILLVATLITILLSFTTLASQTFNDDEHKRDRDRRQQKLNAFRAHHEQNLDNSLSEEMGSITILDPIENLIKLLNESKSNQIWIILAYRESCEQSMELLWRLRHYAVPKIQFDDGGFNNTPYPEITFVPLRVDYDGDDIEFGNPYERLLQMFGISRLPSIFFLLDETESRTHSSNTQTEENVDTQRAISVLAKAQVYHGLSETVDDLVNGLYFYLLRLRLRLRLQLQLQLNGSPAQTQSQNEYEYTKTLPLTAIRIDSLRELRTILRNSDRIIFQNTPLPLDPDLSKDEDLWIRYLMDDNYDGKHYVENEMGRIANDYTMDGLQHRVDSFRVVVQCRTSMKDEESQLPLITKLYQAFDRAAKVLGSRRDVLFSVLEEGNTFENENRYGNERNSVDSFCTTQDDNGQVAAWDGSLLEGNVEESFSIIPTTTSIIDGLSSWLRPLILWFDRRFASLAFNPRYRRHAVLFVDFHNRTTATKMRETIRIFRNECRKQRRNNDDEIDNALLVCLVVPSTEIRIMTTFGIDIWTDMDRIATEKIRSAVCKNDHFNGRDCESDSGEQRLNYIKNPANIDPSKNSANIDPSDVSSVLPVVLVTDRQEDGTIKRYYLDHPITEISLRNFIGDILHGLLKPEIKSGVVPEYSQAAKNNDEQHDTAKNGHNIQTNKHGIHLLTGNSIVSFLKDSGKKHVLLQLYAPTCGHCKRFNTIWNSLGDLIEFLGWSNFLVLARVDVSLNEVLVPGMVPSAWLPDLFYFGVDVYENPVHYGETIFANEFELGGISDPLDLIEWWMDNAGLSINHLESLHQLL